MNPRPGSEFPVYGDVFDAVVPNVDRHGDRLIDEIDRGDFGRHMDHRHVREHQPQDL